MRYTNYLAPTFYWASAYCLSSAISSIVFGFAKSIVHEITSIGHRFLSPVFLAIPFANLTTTSSVTFCTDAAKSISRCVSSVSEERGEPPNKSSNFLFVIVEPVA